MGKKAKDITVHQDSQPSKPKKAAKKKPQESAITEKPQPIVPPKKKIQKSPKNAPISSPKPQPKKKENNKKAKKEQKQKVTKQEKTIKESEELEIEKIDNYNVFITEKLAKIGEIKEKLKTKVNLDRKLITKAVKILLEQHQKTKNPKNILDTNEGFIYVEISFNKLPEHFSIRPIQIKLPHPIYSEENLSKFAIIVRDPQREFKDKIQDMNIPLIAKVIGFTKLIKKHPTYEDKRKLCNSFDYFFCDYKVYDLLRKPTGKFFYARKKIPFPIDIDDVPKHLQTELPNYESYLNDLGNYIYFMMGNGPVYTFKPARVSMDVESIVDNVIEGIKNTLPWIVDSGIKIKHIEQIDLKLFNSVSLPVFNHLSRKDIKAYLAE